ncbi:PEP-CTERM sorting domain-containing protein [Pseudoduganella sp. LjRoot289]|uniref:PEP-CTERM sorting domain-containing protein n=1 Tax=Pseudoduganella sp. LjRoot289 TaxID=3342314 RepID=UPI003ECDF2CA
MINKKFIASISLAIAACSAHATLLSGAWNTSGDNLLTIDSATNLQWLDLSQTLGMTLPQVLDKLGAGQQFSGFQLATVSQVHELMGDAGMPYSTAQGTVSTNASAIQKAQALTALLSNTMGSYGTSVYGSRALLNDNGTDRMVGFYVIDGSSLRNDYFNYSGSAGSGVWLVRQAGPSGQVPEPASLALLGMGLAVLAGMRRRKA